MRLSSDYLKGMTENFSFIFSFLFFSVSRVCHSSHGAYSQSKLALVLFTYYLQEQLSTASLPVTVNAVDPGMVDTALYNNLWRLAQALKKPVAKILFRVNFYYHHFMRFQGFLCFFYSTDFNDQF